MGTIEELYTQNVSLSPTPKWFKGGQGPLSTPERSFAASPPSLPQKRGEKGVEFGNLDVLGCVASQHIQISVIFPFPQAGKGGRGACHDPSPTAVKNL